MGVPAAFVVSLPHRGRQRGRQHDVAVGARATHARPEGATRALERRVASLLVGATALVVSGSLPPGVDPALPVRVASSVRGAGLPVVLDLDGAPLLRAADGGRAVLTPNLDELGRLVHHDGALDVVAAASEVSRRSGAPIVVTLGSDGMVAVDGDSAWHAFLGVEVEGNPPEPVTQPRPRSRPASLTAGHGQWSWRTP